MSAPRLRVCTDSERAPTVRDFMRMIPDDAASAVAIAIIELIECLHLGEREGLCPYCGACWHAGKWTAPRAVQALRRAVEGEQP